MRNLASLRSFVTKDMSQLQTVEMIRILKKQFMRQDAVGNMLVRKFSFAPIEAKNPTVQVVLLPNLWMCSLASFIPELH